MQALLPTGNISLIHTQEQQRLAIDPGDGAIVDGTQSALWDAEVRLLFRAQGFQLLCQGLQPLDCGVHALYRHVQLKAVIFSPEQRLLVLILTHELQGKSWLTASPITRMQQVPCVTLGRQLLHAVQAVTPA